MATPFDEHTIFTMKVSDLIWGGSGQTATCTTWKYKPSHFLSPAGGTMIITPWNVNFGADWTIYCWITNHFLFLGETWIFEAPPWPQLLIFEEDSQNFSSQRSDEIYGSCRPQEDFGHHAAFFRYDCQKPQEEVQPAKDNDGAVVHITLVTTMLS